MASTGAAEDSSGWRNAVPQGVRPYVESAPLTALFLGISSGFPFALLAATLTQRLSEAGIEKKSISAFALALLIYSFKWAWAPLVDRIKLPGSRSFGQRRSWLWLCALLVAGAVAVLGLADPEHDIKSVVVGALLLGFAGATFDIVIDAYRIEILEPRQLGVGSGMSQYGWRLGSFFAASIALFVAARSSWTVGYLACMPLAFAGPIASLFMGEPKRHHEPKEVKGGRALIDAFWGPLADFLKREGAFLVLLFVLIHKIGDTMANLMIRDLLVGLGFTKDEILYGDVWVGFFALLVGIFVGGVLYAKLGMKRSVLVSLILMAISNLSFAGLAAVGHSMPMLAWAVGFENFASGIGGVVVVAYLSALCNLRYTATQFALLSAAAAIVGRFLTGTTAGALIEGMGYVNFYLLTTLIALPGVLLYAYMLKKGLIDESIGDAGTEGEGDARAEQQPAKA
ncbi:AmpG family muropeptide MFS transporter [Sphingomonas hankyongi]|uniref:MFS transporter n=1 Tax=Sphingomonas hankyongi TaxID=2908209 RepID=A0ABT0RYM9_9SPHN|nr:MFS transporter [Sphingomonas hankyongi]MCL6728692.1 MFS transporter [Sphingomonas hankyongi]